MQIGSAEGEKDGGKKEERQGNEERREGDEVVDDRAWSGPFARQAPRQGSIRGLARKAPPLSIKKATRETLYQLK